MRYIFILTFFVCSLVANSGVKLIKNLEYDEYKKTKLDMYIPKKNLNKKVIFMVHGGGWAVGDKKNRNVVKNKKEFFTKQGFVFISTNYRLVPDVDVYTQALDVAKALEFSQNYLKKYDIKSEDFIVMGHSAGAHLVSLIASDSKIKEKFNIYPWKATVSIDTGAFDVVDIMENKHIKVFDFAFGKDKEFWKKVSPLEQLKGLTTPFLVICSTKRKTSCKKNDAFVKKARALGNKIEILKVNFTHKQLNKNLGLNNKYTKDVDTYISNIFEK